MASEDIVKLEFPSSVRRRFGMYVGSADNASVILREALDNGIDELYAGQRGSTPCDTVWLDYKDEVYTVADNCRGIPTKESPQQKGWTMARLAVGSLHAGSKFEGDSLSIGTNGVGISCSCALSEYFYLYSRMKLQEVSLLPKKLREQCPEVTDSLYYYCKFEKGGLKEEGFKELPELEKSYGQFPSTITRFHPDLTIFKSGRASLPSSLPYVNYILKNDMKRDVHIIVNGKEYKDTLKSYGIDFSVVIPSSDADSANKNLKLLVTMGFQEKLDPCEVIGSVNGLDCPQGFHIRLFQNAFDKAFKETFSDCKRYEFMGMRIAVIALCNEPTYSSQTKERLADVDGFKSNRDYELNYIGKALKKLFKDEKYYSQFKNHELKILEYMKSTEKLGRKEFIKSTVLIASQSSRSDAMVPEKLIDCSSTNRGECELYLCFTGDTEVLDCNNSRIRFDELSERIQNGEEIYTFSCDEEGYKSPSKITECKESKKVTTLVKVTLDNGESFKSTLDHKIMMKDGTYKEAQYLEVGDSCMPIYIATYPKVISVEFIHLESPEPVYCLTVDNELHNFPLACGIFVKNCEGNSAGGSLVSCRDPRIHAILPLRGKVLNTTKLEIEQVLSNREMKDLISAIGVGVNDYHDMSEVRYGKLIIVADAD